MRTATGKLHLFMFGRHNGRLGSEPHRGCPFFLFFFLWALTLTPQRAELQRALINGSRDAPALLHSPLHNRWSREAEQGMEYWWNEWKRTQNKRAGITPVHSQSPLLIVSLCWGESGALSITEDQRSIEEMDVKKCYWGFISHEMTFQEFVFSCIQIPKCSVKLHDLKCQKYIFRRFFFTACWSHFKLIS